MPKRYIFDPDNFDGNCLTTIETTTGKLDYTQMTWDEFNAAHGGNLRALGWIEFDRDWRCPYLQGIQKPWQECTEAEYDYSLGAVPPIKHRGIAGFDTFFCGEATTAHLHQMFAYKGRRYWTALRSILRSTEDLSAELLELMSEITGRVLSFDGRELRLEGHSIVLFTQHDDDYREFDPGETWRICYSIVNDIPTIYTAYVIGS
jgi:hypothetical protein